MARVPALLYSSNRFLNASIQEEETSYFKASNGGKKEKIIRHLVPKAEAQVVRLAFLPEHAHVRLLPSCVIVNGSPDSSLIICFVLTFDSAGGTAGVADFFQVNWHEFIYNKVLKVGFIIEKTIHQLELLRDLILKGAMAFKEVMNDFHGALVSCENMGDDFANDFYNG